MSDATTPDLTNAKAIPDYVGVVKFLLEPFLESPESLKVDCEVLPRNSRVLIRVAFDGEDRGRVYGRGGRNIQAIRTVLQGIARTFGYSLHLDVFGGQPTGRDDGIREASPERRSNFSKPMPRRARPN
ncbi:MAG: KH domain-containing protein [Cyanobacteria bacterium J069]